MTAALVSTIWQANQAAVLGPVRKLTPDNYRNRLTPATASTGFIALHIAEVMHRIASLLFGHQVAIPIQTMGVSDEGKLLDLMAVQRLVNESFAMVAEHIQQTDDDQWNEIVVSPFGPQSRLQLLTFLMHHNSYHAGQIAQALKKGKELSLENYG